MGSVTLSGASTLDTTDNGADAAGAGISLATVTGDGHALTLNAGSTGTITVSGDIDNVSLLTIADSGGATFQGTLGGGTAGAVMLANTTGTIAFQGDTHITTLTTAAQGYNVTFGKAGTPVTDTVDNPVTFLNTGTLTLGLNAADVLTFSGGLTAIVPAVHLAGTVETAGQPIALGSVTLSGASTLDTTDNGTDAAGAGISLATVTGNGQALTLNAGTTGTITVSGPVDNVSLLTIANSGGATFQGTLGGGTAGAVMLANTTGTIAFQGDTHITTLTTAAQGYNVTFGKAGTPVTDTVDNPVTFLNTGTLTLGLNAADVLTFSGGLTASAPAVHLDGKVETARQPIALGSVTLSGASTLDTTDNGADAAGAGISLATVTGDGHALTLNAGSTGTITVSGDIDNVPLLTIADSGGATFQGTLGGGTAGAVMLANTTGTIAFQGDTHITTLTTAAQGYNVTFGKAGTPVTDTVDNPVTFLNTGTLTLGLNAADVLTFSGGLTAIAPAVHLDGTVETAGQPIALGSVTLSGASTLDTTDNGADAAGAGISLATVAGDGQALTLNAGSTGTITVSGDIDNVSLLTIANSGGATFQGTVGEATAGAVTLANTTGTIAFQGDTHITTLTTAAQGYNVTFGKAGTPVTDTVDNPVTFLNTGTLTLGLNAADVLTFSGGLTAIAPAVHLDGTVQTARQPIALGSVTLSGASTLDTTDNGADAAGAGISLATVTGNGQALTLNAGTTGTITVSGDIDNVSLLTIADSGGATFQGTLGEGTAGAVTLTDTTGTIAFQGDTRITTLTTAAQGYNVTFGKAGTPVADTVDNPVTFLNTGTLTLGLNTADVLTFSGGLTAIAPAVHLDGTVQTARRPIALGSLTLSGAGTLDTTDNGADAAGAGISLATVTGDGQALTLNAGTTGTITVSGDIDNVSLLTIANSGGATFQGKLGGGTAGAVMLANTTGTIAFQGDTHITTLTTAAQGYNVTFGKAGTPVTDTVDNPVTFLNTGTLTLGLNAADVLTFSGGLTATPPRCILTARSKRPASRSPWAASR